MSDDNYYGQQASELQMKIENCMLKALQSSQYLLDSQVIEEIRLKIEEIADEQSIVSSIDHFLFTLINKLQFLGQRTHKLDVNMEDYQNLEAAMQKAEGEIRKHIRLEQQLKLYMDGLEEKVQQLENQLKLESKKYHQLFESAKVLDIEKRQLKKKLNSIEMKNKSHDNKQLRVISQKASKILLSEPSVQQIHYPYYAPSNDKYKLLRHKRSTDKGSQAPKQKNNISSHKKILDNEINVSLHNSPIKKKSVHESNETNKEFNNTIHLKQGYRKNSRKLMKYSTQQSRTKKEVRCNSVCQ